MFYLYVNIWLPYFYLPRIFLLDTLSEPKLFKSLYIS